MAAKDAWLVPGRRRRLLVVTLGTALAVLVCVVLATIVATGN